MLLVEDDPNDALLTRRAFGKAGIVASLGVVTDGEQAVAYLAGDGAYADRGRHPLPVFVLLDLKLPRRSGFEVLEWLRGHPVLGRMVVVVLTASADPADVARAYDLGANSYLVKPSSFETLVDMVRVLWRYWIDLNCNPPA